MYFCFCYFGLYFSGYTFKLLIALFSKEEKLRQLWLSFEKQRVETLDLERFDVSRTRGFLPDNDPVVNLPSSLAFVEEFGRALPHLLSETMLRRRFRALVEQELPLVNLADIGVENREVARAIYRTYGFIASAYVHTIGESSSVEKLPKNLALPLWFSAWRLGKKPILSYDGYVLWNWKRKDLGGSIELENLETIQNFVTLLDEARFILLNVEIEVKAAPAIAAIGAAQQAVLDEDIPALVDALLTILCALKEMLGTLKILPEHCSPEVFYRDFQPYLQSFGRKEGNKRKEGIVFEGVKAMGEEPVFLNGASETQSSAMPSLVAILGIRHMRTDLVDYLYLMENYMPVGHREFIRAIRRGPNVRGFVKNVNLPVLKDAYNNCIERLYALRSEHLSIATEYTKRIENSSLAAESALSLNYLSILKEETIAHRLS